MQGGQPLVILILYPLVAFLHKEVANLGVSTGLFSCLCDQGMWSLTGGKSQNKEKPTCHVPKCVGIGPLGCNFPSCLFLLIP